MQQLTARGLLVHVQETELNYKCDCGNHKSCQQSSFMSLPRSVVHPHPRQTARAFMLHQQDPEIVFPLLTSRLQSVDAASKAFLLHSVPNSEEAARPHPTVQAAAADLQPGETQPQCQYNMLTCGPCVCRCVCM